MLRSILLLAALSLALPLASSQPTAPELPHVKECSEFQVDWYHCDALVCVYVWWGSLERSACVANPCPGFACTVCTADGCLQPDVWTCSESPTLSENDCPGYFLCAQVEWDPFFTTHPACVESFACPTGQPCGDPWVRYCSEFFVDWYHCAGQVVCVQAGYQNVQTRNLCVPNPCSPWLAGCIVCEICQIPARADG